MIKKSGNIKPNLLRIDQDTHRGAGFSLGVRCNLSDAGSWPFPQGLPNGHKVGGRSQGGGLAVIVHGLVQIFYLVKKANHLCFVVHAVKYTTAYINSPSI